MQGIFAFLNPLFGSTSPIIELHYLLGPSAEIGHHKAGVGQKLSPMPLHFGNHPSRPLPAGGLVVLDVVPGVRIGQRKPR